MICAFLTHNYFLAIMFGNAGLIAGAFGDVFLGLRDNGGLLKKDHATMMGFVAFGVAQIFNFLMLAFYGGFSYFALLIGLCIAVAIYFGEKLLKLNYGNLRWFVLGYTFLLASAFGQAIMTMVSTGFARASILLAIGMALFFASDMVLAFIYFRDTHNKSLVYVNYGLYYAAQILIAASLFLM